MKLFSRSWVLLWVCTHATLAAASPRSLGLSYPYETLEESEVAILQVVDVHSNLDVDRSTNRSPQFGLQAAYEYGISPHAELGLYVSLDGGSGDPLQVDGTRQHIRVRLAEPNQWVVDLALNFEIVEYRYALAFEETVIMQKHIGPLTVISNTTIEEELEEYRLSPALILGQTLGLDLALSEHFHLGGEYWLRTVLMRGHSETELDAPLEPAPIAATQKYQNFIGPAISLQWKHFWWTTNAYVRLDRAARMDGEVQPVANTHAYDRLRVRSMVGIIL